MIDLSAEIFELDIFTDDQLLTNREAELSKYVEEAFEKDSASSICEYTHHLNIPENDVIFNRPHQSRKPSPVEERLYEHLTESFFEAMERKTSSGSFGFQVETDRDHITVPKSKHEVVVRRSKRVRLTGKTRYLADMKMLMETSISKGDFNFTNDTMAKEFRIAAEFDSICSQRFSAHSPLTDYRNPIVKVNGKNGVVVNATLFHSASEAQLREMDTGDLVDRPNDVAMRIISSHRDVTIGEFHFGPLGKKTSVSTGSSELYCTVSNGTFDVTINDQQKTVKKHDFFRIPSFNDYSIHHVLKGHNGIIQFQQVEQKKVPKKSISKTTFDQLATH